MEVRVSTTKPAPDAVRAAFLADLDMVISNLDEVFRKVVAECPAPGGDPKVEGKFEGVFLTLRGVLADELGPMRDAWAGGGQFSRRGEHIAAGTVDEEGAKK